jgi:hypothetical protein
MKTSLFVIATCVASASAFAPSGNGRQATELAEKKSIFKTITEMDLFAPKSTQNDYGARNQKNLGVGKIGSNSYIPNGLTAAQYEKLRKDEAAKKAANYQRNVAKAGKFLDYTDFYTKRGTDTGEAWSKSVTKGHDMAKTKYDWSGSNDQPLWAKSPTKKGKK